MDIKGKQARNDGDDDNLIKIIEELEIQVVSKRRQLDETVKKLRLHGGKEKSNQKVVKLEKMLSISRDENFALKIKINEMEKCMEEKEEELKDLKSFNQNIMVMEHKNNHENQEDRKELIKNTLGRQGCVNIGAKRLGESDLALCAAALKKRKCSGPQETGLEWNSESCSKVASLKKGFSFVFEKLKNVGNIVVSSLSIATTNSSLAPANPSSFATGPNIAATNRSSSAPPSYQDPCEIPEAEFHDFMADKSYGKFRSGQIWALYCDLDELPKYYVQIIQVKLNPDFELHAQHLNSSHSQRCQLQWADKNMPICCGTFKVEEETVVYKDMKSAFSHQCCSKLVWKDNYEIYPRKGEVWAMYKDFDSKWTCTDLKNCKYDIVEVLRNKGSRIKVLVLEQVTGLKTVFTPKKNSSGADIMLTKLTNQMMTHMFPEMFLQIHRSNEEKSVSSEIERLKSIIIEMKNRQGSKDKHDDEASNDFMTTRKILEEFEALNQSIFSKQCHAYGKLNQTLQKLRHHGGKEKLDEMTVELDMMMNMFRDANVELQRKIDEMGKFLEEKKEQREEVLGGGKEKSNNKIGELEKMLNISRDENFALKIRIDELEKGMEEKKTDFNDLESFNQNMMVRERKYNDENQEAREELINSMQGLQGCVNIGIKRLGELDPAPFAAAVKKRKCSGSGSDQEASLDSDAGAEAELLCSLWEKHLEDPGWHPFRIVMNGDKYQEIIDDEDPKLKGLESELGEDAYRAVTTSLMETNEYNPSGRYPVSEIWNFVEGRKASLKEGYSFVFEKLKNVGKSSVVSSPICSPTSPNIGVTNSSSSAPSYLGPCEIPHAEFHDFKANISYGKFQSGHIWALYCDSDDLPKYYVQITQVKLNLGFELHVRYLDSSHSPRCKLQWADKNMPICCGMFKVRDEAVVYKDVKSFSHQLSAKQVSESDYEIYPRRGEVWALYEDFDSKWTCSDLKKCKYDIVEVLRTINSKINVSELEQVTGLKTVFKQKKNAAGGYIVREITRAMFLTFSHQIPAFRLTNEKEGSLRGYWELDPNSIPVYLFSSD